MYCMNCGVEIKDGVAFCPKCGTKQDLLPKQEGESSVRVPAEKKKHLAGGIFGAVCIVGVLAVIVVLFFFHGRADEPDSSKNDTHPVAADESQPSEDGKHPVAADESQPSGDGKHPVVADGETTVKYPVVFHVYSCMDVRSDGDGTTVGEPLPGVAVTVRESYDNYNGEAVCTAEPQNGVLKVELPSGMYTLQFQTDGYLDAYAEVEVAKEAVEQDIYVMPELSESQTGIILTWDGTEVDLDLILLTPWQTKRGDMVYIGRNADQDVYGNCLISDNTDRCEAMLVNSGEEGIYKLYVNNYTDSMSGNYASDALSRANVHVFVYHADGLAAEYTVPLGQNGVVWEIAMINGSDITPEQRIYSEVSGQTWSMEEKGVWSEDEDLMLLETLQAEDSTLRKLMETLVHPCAFYYSADTINMLLRGETEGIEKFFGLNGEGMPPVVYLQFTWENSVDYLDGDRFDQPGDCEYFLTGEQAGFLLRSVCGKPIDFDFSVYADWQDPYIGFGRAAGDITRNELEHFSVERMDADTWKVSAYNEYTRFYEPSVLLNRVCFTVIRNPGSCFEDYSLTGFEVEEEANTDWMKLYYDYLTTDPEGIAFMNNFMNVMGGRSEYLYSLIYVDDDMIPEIYLEGAGDWYSDILLFISNGKVEYEIIGMTDGGIEYIPYAGILNGHVGMGSGEDITYKLENGSLSEIGHDGYESFVLGGTEVTEKQYRKTIDGYIGNGKLQKCVFDTYGCFIWIDPVSWLSQEMN